ncbi:MAG: YidC/Oxa1 family membrane protein insertase [Peptostreptococcaceae bacterium]
MSIINNLMATILSFIFDFVNSYGFSIILFTIFIKLLLLPLTIKQTKSTKAMQDIQPKIQEIQLKYKDKPEKQSQEIMELYKEAKINPMAGCLPLLIQMPILIGLFSVLREPWVYGIFENQVAYEAADTSFLFLSNLTQAGNMGDILSGQIQVENLIMAILSGGSSYLMQTVMMPNDPKQQETMKTMTYVMTIMSFVWGYTFPAGLALYWVVSNVFSIAQYYLVMNPLKAKLESESTVDLKVAVTKEEDAKKNGKKHKNQK